MVAMTKIFQHIPVQIKPPPETFQCIVLFKDHAPTPYSNPPQRIEADISMVYLQQLIEKKLARIQPLQKPHGVRSPSPAATDIGR